MEPGGNSTTRGHRTIVFLLAVVGVIALAWQVRPEPRADPRISTLESRGGLTPAFIPAEEIDRLIAAYERRVKEQTDALDFRTLGLLYLEKGRSDGDVARFEAAAEAFGRAAELFPSDVEIRIGSAAAAFAVHEFDKARTVAAEVYGVTGRVDALALMFDAALAMGDYEEAEGLLDELMAAVGDQPGLLVRRAEWARLNGRVEELRSISDEILTSIADSSNPRFRSWFDAFVAQLLFDLGEYARGLALAETAVEADPESPLARVVLARHLAATGEPGRARTIYEEVVEAVPDPTYLAELVSLHEATGQTERADAVYEAIAVSAEIARGTGVYDQALAVALADRGDNPDLAVEIADANLSTRQDVGAFDALAWALHSAGRNEEAWVAAREAISRGTIEPVFYYHAGMIALARGDTDSAGEMLETALSLSPRFDPLHAVEAETALATLP